MPSLKVTRYFSLKASGYSTASRRGLWRWIRANESSAVFAMLGELKGKSVVDLGAGAGFYSLFCFSRGAVSVTAVDACSEMLAGIGDERIKTHCADIADFVSDSEFDSIVCAGVLEFVSDPVAVLTSARKLAGSSCKFALLVPRWSFLSLFYFLFHLSHGIRVKLFSESCIAGFAGKSGWRVSRSVRVFPFSSVYCLEPAAVDE